MKKYRIVSNGELFRIQQHRAFLGFEWWSWVYHYYPSGCRMIKEFDCRQVAEAWITESERWEEIKARPWTPL